MQSEAIIAAMTVEEKAFMVYGSVYVLEEATTIL
jgi:hypothetical protein